MRLEYILKVIKILLGTFISGVGVICLIHANIGVEPWSVLHQGMANTFNMTYGRASIIVGVVVLIIGILLKEPFGYATIGNIFLCGIFIDSIEMSGLVPYMNTLPAGCVMMITGMFILSYGTYVYMSSQTGSGPRDMLMVAFAKITKKTPGGCRIVTEAVVLLTGWLLSGPVGIGTIISTFGMGLVINIVFHVTRFHPEHIQMENALETTRNIKMAFSSHH